MDTNELEFPSVLIIMFLLFHFFVLGEGSRREWMRLEARRKRLGNLHLPGGFPVETMPGFMHKASALLVTLADQEIFKATIPSKVQAYLAADAGGCDPFIACRRQSARQGARAVVYTMRNILRMTC